jgi:hypothetical protein
MIEVIDPLTLEDLEGVTGSLHTQASKSKVFTPDSEVTKAGAEFGRSLLVKDTKTPKLPEIHAGARNEVFERLVG